MTKKNWTSFMDVPLVGEKLVLGGFFFICVVKKMFRKYVFPKINKICCTIISRQVRILSIKMGKKRCRFK